MIKGSLFLLYNLGISLYYFAYLIFYYVNTFFAFFSKKKNTAKIVKIFPHLFLKYQPPPFKKAGKNFKTILSKLTFGFMLFQREN